MSQTIFITKFLVIKIKHHYGAFLYASKRVGLRPTSAFLGCYTATDLYFVKIRFLKRGKLS